MPVTTLDPKTALIVIDLQKGMRSRTTVHPLAEVVERATALAAAFRRHALPVVLVNVTGGAPGRTEQPRPAAAPPPDWAELLPELGQQPTDLTITKRTWGAFPGTDLAARLKSLGTTQVVLCGISTSIGVETTAREAYALGLNITLAIDAMTDTSEEAHLNSTTRIFPRLGETGTAADIVALLDKTR